VLIWQGGDVLDQQMRRLGDHLNQRDWPASLLKEIDDMVGYGLHVILRHRLWFAADHRNPL
jgi:hypothetical protein